MPPIFLLGFMGSGKSAVARHLSKQLQLPLIDLDQRIEAEIGTSIANYFASEGEEAFRAIETRTLEAVPDQNAVISLGGGVPTREINREILKNMARNGALVVYLQATAPTLAQRIRRQPGKRPLIDGDGHLDLAATENRVRELLEQRSPLYLECSNLVLETDGLNIPDIAEAIAAHWRGEAAI
jgi:shikimate kinase